MKIRFAVNQGESLRRGVDAPRSTMILEVDPRLLPQNVRDMIADRMAAPRDIGVYKIATSTPHIPQDLLLANTPDWEGFLVALEADEACRLIKCIDAEIARKEATP